MTSPGMYAKAIIGALVAGLGALTAGLADGTLELVEGLTALSAGLAALGAVYGVSNTKPDDDAEAGFTTGNTLGFFLGLCIVLILLKVFGVISLNR